MNFKKYPSIENIYRERFIENVRVAGYANENYHVQEKIHGVNLAIYCDGESIQFAAREHVITGDEKFYGLNDISQELAIDAFNLWHIIKQYEAAEFVTGFIIYGELFGGMYPHSEVPKNNDVIRVQKGVHYGPDTMFIAFDLYVTSQEPEDLSEGSFINVSFANNLFDTVGITRAETLHFGNLDSCLEYSSEFQTTIPSISGLPEIEDNICEGVVIKPDNSLYLNSGKRVVIKNKNERFSEKNRERKHKPTEPLSPITEAFVNTALSYVNENRYNNVVSKMGEIDYDEPKNISILIPALVKDVMEDFVKENPDFTHLDKTEKKASQKAVTNAAKSLILKKF